MPTLPALCGFAPNSMTSVLIRDQRQPCEGGGKLEQSWESRGLIGQRDQVGGERRGQQRHEGGRDCLHAIWAPQLNATSGPLRSSRGSGCFHLQLSHVWLLHILHALVKMELLGEARVCVSA